MRERRFLVEPADLHEADALIRGPELQHLRKVLRLRAGDPVSVFDGRGRGYSGHLSRVDGEEALVILEEAESRVVEPFASVTLLQSVLHTERMESIVEKVTEMGVKSIVPVISERSVVRPKGERWGRLDRLRRIAVSAAKQSGRLVVPEIHEPAAFDEAVERRPGDGLKLCCQAGSPPLWGLIRAERAGSVSLLVGPEGGWTGEELERATGSGWQGVGLGPTTLRADTAAVLATGLILALSGEGREP